MKIFILTSISISSLAFSSDLPSWIVKGPMSDSSFHYVVCSHDGIDPEEARQIAESKCLASAAKIGGVNVRLTQKTVQSLTGSDSSEVAEIHPIQANVKCEWINRFLEKIKGGYRIWLQCQVLKSNTTSFSPVEMNTSVHKSIKLIEATLVLSMLPKADRIIVIDVTGERVIEPTSNTVSILISNLDQKVAVHKLGYRELLIELPKDIFNDSKIQRDAILNRD